MNLTTLTRLGGRRYAVVIRVLELGFLLSLIGLLVAVMEPSIAQYVAAILGAFGMLGSVAVGAYQGANAAQDWKSPGASHTPAPRASGMIPEPKEGP